MTVRLLTEHHLEFLSFKGGCTGWSESTLVEKPHCWKSHVTAQLCNNVVKDVTMYGCSVNVVGCKRKLDREPRQRK